MKDVIIGIDIGGTHLRIGAVDRAGQVTCFEKRHSREVCGDGGSAQRLIALIRDYFARYGLASRAIALAIGFPSTVSRNKRTVYSSPNLPLGGVDGLDGQDVVARLKMALGLPTFIDRDTIFLLQYDLVRLDLKDKGTTIGIYYGTGIGNAVYLDGKFLVGKHGVAAELGHIPYYGSKNSCGCGSRGCAETHAGGYVLRNLWQEYFSSEPFSEIFLRHGEDVRIRAFIEAMAIPFATELNLFDPDQVIIGGGVVEMTGFPMEALLGFVREFVRKPYPCEDYALIRASAAPEIGVVGAAYYAMERIAKASFGLEEQTHG
ncbi:MAG: allose kinase [Eubacteriales bacterium]|nr:allose kinase [Eubacteriales bacterium]